MTSRTDRLPARAARRWGGLVAHLAALLLAAPVGAAELGEWRLRAEEVVPGVRYLELERGEVARETRFEVAVGASSKQAQADRLVWAVVEAGFEPVVVYGSGRYEIRVGGFVDAGLAEEARAALARTPLAAGARVVESGHDVASPGGPWVAHVLEADPAAVEVRAAHALDASFGLETTSSIARRQGSLAAINGGFYLLEGELAGDSTGTLIVDGELLSEPDRGRATAGFLRAGGRTRFLAGRPRLCAVATLSSGDQIGIDGIDRRRGRGEAILYTPHFHRTTLTGPEGLEAVLVGGRISAVRRGGGTTIPEGGFVLSLAAERISEDGVELRPGEGVEVALRLLSRADDSADRWDGIDSAVSAGPLLVARGEPVARPELESISQVFSRARHPRTAVGARADGTLLFVVVEGRMPERSVGMSLEELSALLLELGAVEAVNLDGGGSSAMAIGGVLVSRPSDRDGERANGDALLLFPAGREEAPSP